MNKVGSINAQFRFFEMELIAGEPDYVVEHVRCIYYRYSRLLTSLVARVGLQIYVRFH